MKKITYVYQGGRKNHMDSSTNGAKDFYYGATLFNKLEFEADTPIQTIITTTDILNIEQSGILNTSKNVTNHHLTR